MKPNELMWSLMAPRGLNPRSLAVKIKRPTMQPSIARFLHGEGGLAITTTMPIASELGVGPEVFHDERKATAYAREHGIKPVPLPVKKPRPRTKVVDPIAAKIADLFARVARDGVRSLSASDQRLHAQIQSSYTKTVDADPDGLTGNTGSGNLDELPAGAMHLPAKRATKAKGSGIDKTAEQKRRVIIRKER